MKQVLQRVRPILWILLGVVILELLLSNVPSLAIPKKAHRELAADLRSDENGQCYVEEITIQDSVKNVYVCLDEDGANQAEVTISLTDEGDRYPYDLPVRKVVRRVKDTSYISIYPFGKVNTISLAVKSLDGSSVHVKAAEINRRKPFSFHLGRAIFVFAIAAFLSLGFGPEGVAKACEKGNKKQWVICVAAFLLVMLVGWKLVHINPIFTNPPWPHHRQYQELAEVMSKGQVKLDYEPSEGLLEAKNPYDTISLLAENVPYLMDYAYYDGAYYVYFGLIPELLFYLPYYLVTGNHLMNWQVIYLCYLLFAAGVFILVRELAYRFGKKVTFLHTLFISLLICLFPNYVYILCRPDIYHIPILSGSAFLTCSVSMFLLGARQEKQIWKSIAWITASLCGAFVAGCRPQLMLYEILLLVLLLIGERRINEKDHLFGTVVCKKDILSILIPYIGVGILVFWYNYARFGNGFDFGATYSLTTNDMNHRGFSLLRILQGLFGFLLQPLNLQARFPFIIRSDVHYGFMGKDLSEFSFGGVISSCTFLWPIFLLPYFCVKERKEKHSHRMWVWICLLSCSVIIAAFDANSAGILQRYFADAVWGLCMLGCLLWMYILDFYAEDPKFPIRQGFVCAMLFTLLFSFFIMFARGDANCVESYNADFYYLVSSWFSF